MPVGKELYFEDWLALFDRPTKLSASEERLVRAKAKERGVADADSMRMTVLCKRMKTMWLNGLRHAFETAAQKVYCNKSRTTSPATSRKLSSSATKSQRSPRARRSRSPVTTRKRTATAKSLKHPLEHNGFGANVNVLLRRRSLLIDCPGGLMPVLHKGNR